MKKINKLMAMMAAVGMGVGAAVAGNANSIVVDGSTTVGPIAKAFAEYYMGKHKDVNITVSESGSGNGAKSLINAACDVATMSRPMKNSEKKAAQDAGVLAIEHIVAMDGIAMIVHPSNPRGDLTMDQIRDIYTGKITNWKDVGGSDQAIVVISRDTNSGTFETFKEMVLGKEAKISEGAEYTGSNGAVRQRVQMTKGAIGYAGLGFVDHSVKAMEINGIVPSAETVINKTYPIARELFMFTNGEPKPDSLIAKFIALSHAQKGRELIEEIGFIPVPEKK